MKRAAGAILLLLLLVPLCAFSAQLNTLSLSVSACEDGTPMPPDAVNWYPSKGSYVLLLPGGTDWNETRLWYTGSARELIIDGTAYHSGDRIAGLQNGSEMTITLGKKSIRVNVMQGSDIGAIFINTQSGSMKKVDRSKKVREPGTLRLLMPDGTYAYDGELSHIKLRGNTSSVLPKKNYTIKLARGADLFGMGKAKHWVLQGSYRDKTQLRNQIVYSMAAYVGLRYTPQVVQVDLYLNHEYHGTYLLTEKIEVHPERVDIADLQEANEAVNPEPLDSYPITGSKEPVRGKYKAAALPQSPADITGGYILEYENSKDRYHSEACAFRTAHGKVILLKEPEIASQAQVEYISAFMQGYENAIFAQDGVDPASGKRYDEYVDMDSLVLKYMLEQVSMNCDGNISSQYYVKPSDSQSTVAFAGPAWDYDTTFGDFAPSSRPYLAQPDRLIHGRVRSGEYWWPRLYVRPEFRSRLEELWRERYSRAMLILMGQETDPAGILLSVDEYAANLERSNLMNEIRWPIRRINQQSRNQADTGGTLQSNMAYLKDFISRRYVYLESIWGGSR